MSDDRGEPDVSIEASFFAKELKHLEKPSARLSVGGLGEIEEDSVREREGIPEEVEPGRTYRNVKITRRLSGRLVDPRED